MPNTDELIYEEVHMLLKHQVDIDLSNVELTVKDGEVILEGSISQPLSNLQLDKAIAVVAGVQHVDNRLTVIADSSSTEAKKKRDFSTSS